MKKEKEMRQETRSNSLLIPVAAALAGAAAALLLAPKSGRETREDIRGKARELNDQAHRGYDSARSKVGENMEKVRERKDAVAEALRSTGEEVKQDIDKERGRYQARRTTNKEEM